MLNIFNIFKKKQEPFVQFWPSREGITEYTPLVPAKNYLPDWWKKIGINERVTRLDSNPISTGTIRRCPGVLDFLNLGWVLPAWCDISLNVTKHQISWDFSDASFGGESHKHFQFISLLPDNAREKYLWVFKPYSPWVAVTSPGYRLLQLDPFYHFNDYFDSAPGILDSDKYHDTNPLLLIKKAGEYVIERGTPLAVFLPIKRETVVGECMPYDNAQYRKLEARNMFVAKSKFSSLVTYKEEQYKLLNCPFHSKES